MYEVGRGDCGGRFPTSSSVFSSDALENVSLVLRRLLSSAAWRPSVSLRTGTLPSDASSTLGPLSPFFPAQRGLALHLLLLERASPGTLRPAAALSCTGKEAGFSTREALPFP